MALVLLVVECAFFAEGLFHLGESAHRSWKIATVVTAASLFMIPLLVTPRPGRWYLFAVVSSLFAAIAYFCMPRRELFLDFSKSDGIASTGLVLLPAFLAWAWVLLVSRKKASGGERGFHAKIRAATLFARVAVCCGVPMALLAGALWALAQRAATHSNVQLPPSFGWAAVAGVTASCFVGLMVGTIFWLLQKSEPFRWMTKGAVLTASAVGSLFFMQNGYSPA